MKAISLRNGELFNTVRFKILSELPYLFQTVTFNFLILHLLMVLLYELELLPVETRQEKFPVTVVLLQKKMHNEFNVWICIDGVKQKIKIS